MVRVMASISTSSPAVAVGEVLGVPRSVGHHPDPVLEPVHGAVVDHQPVVVAEGAVADLPDVEAEDVVGVHPLGGGQRVGTAELPLVERRDVPHAEVVADGLGTHRRYRRSRRSSTTPPPP